MIGLLGAHRTGKSTLMYEFVKKHPTVKATTFNVGALQKELGFNSNKQDYPFDVLMQIQEHLILRFEQHLEGLEKIDAVLRQESMYISDRTPLDLIGYTMIHANGNLSKVQSDWLIDYVDKCIQLTNKYYDKLILIQPGIRPVKDNDTSAEPILGFMEHLNAIYLSYMIDNRVTPQKLIMPRDLLDLQQRVEFIL